MKIALNGCFDLLHGGHIGFIKQAAEMGEVVIILNNDEVVREKGRPVFLPQNERKYILENIKGVSEVIIAEEYNPNNALSVGRILEQIRPDVIGLVEGTEKGENLIPVCEGLGIKIIWLKRTNGESSSEIVRKVYDSLPDTSKN